MEREEAKQNILDIILRRDQERPLETWHSDIARMTDMLLWLYQEWSKPMTYSKGNRIVFSESDWEKVPCSKEISEIEKTPDGYIITIDGEKSNLNDFDDESSLAKLLHLLLWKEWIQWDYCCDLAADYRHFNEELCRQAGVKSLKPIY